MDWLALYAEQDEIQAELEQKKSIADIAIFHHFTKNVVM